MPTNISKIKLNLLNITNINEYRIESVECIELSEQKKTDFFLLSLKITYTQSVQFEGRTKKKNIYFMIMIMACWV